MAQAQQGLEKLSRAEVGPRDTRNTEIERFNMPKQLVDPEGGVGGMSEEDIAWERARLRIGLGVEVPRERRWMYFAGEARKGRMAGDEGLSSNFGLQGWLILGATGAVMAALGWMLAAGSGEAGSEARNLNAETSESVRGGGR
jgi:hypothetical protein